MNFGIEPDYNQMSVDLREPSEKLAEGEPFASIADRYQLCQNISMKADVTIVMAVPVKYWVACMSVHPRPKPNMPLGPHATKAYYSA